MNAEYKLRMKKPALEGQPLHPPPSHTGMLLATKSAFMGTVGVLLVQLTNSESNGACDTPYREEAASQDNEA